MRKKCCTSLNYKIMIIIRVSRWPIEYNWSLLIFNGSTGECQQFKNLMLRTFKTENPSIICKQLKYDQIMRVQTNYSSRQTISGRRREQFRKITAEKGRLNKI